ncbi:tyrosine--tRNA ligase [Helicobacter cappadocius]|uniref:Tyrosine--tRNA ligase n=1 Tax=Helicobacter cappadocius TaxID=3063998 RepID=A0AA90PRK5_9HELI|nr:MULTISPECIES: tyrosine--tRNA ligase [unclassified Helicobacter]MDO7253107.1 tyrosine--tRNA ligase [Helicobacter sp. faydin-H75]MDP2538767.1 tyrosine--tRNA ligase [Helicobacter sp. faydin-H76]
MDEQHRINFKAELSDKTKEAMAEISRGCSEFIGADYIASLVERFNQSSERFIVKAGFDPTAPDLHLGHTVLIQKLATFQKYGGDVKFLIGDFTATIGDPSGKSETRKQLSKEEVQQNALTYKEQVFKILDPKHTEICFNSKWINDLGVGGLVDLTSKFSVARMLERDDFEKRYKEGRPISIIEFMYPLLQGYDSVALKCDIELGGNDQKFNLLVGRTLQRAYGINKEQSVLTVPLLEGLDGVNKMSKSLGNYIGVTENPNSMYAKIMSISDELMWKYYELLSTKTIKELQSLKNSVIDGVFHPKKAKEVLALEIVQRYHGLEFALNAKEEFDKVFAKDEMPSEILEMEFEKDIWICELLKLANLSSSTSQARRDIQGGAVKVNKDKIMDQNYRLQSGDYIIQVGKRKFIKAVIK